MSEEQQDVIVDSSPTPDVPAESSPAAPVEAPTSKAGQEQAVPYDRFKEVAEEKNYWREQAMLATQRQQPTQQPSDPYAGMDAQTKVFYQEIDSRAKKIASEIISEKEKDFRGTIETLAMQNAKIQEKLFRSEQKDVLPNSPEEKRIATLIRAGLDPEEAAWAVMGPKRVESVKTVKQTQQQAKIQEKAQANLENASMPANHGIPPKEKLSFRESLAAKMREAGL